MGCSKMCLLRMYFYLYKLFIISSLPRKYCFVEYIIWKLFRFMWNHENYWSITLRCSAVRLLSIIIMLCLPRLKSSTTIVSLSLEINRESKPLENHVRPSSSLFTIHGCLESFVGYNWTCLNYTEDTFNVAMILRYYE